MASRRTQSYYFYEFFAGGGMARAGLGTGWRCLFANDFDHKKGRIYRENWGGDELKTADVGSLTTKDLPGIADLVWASFPCQDLSLAGGGAGLRGDRSGTFWPFWNLMKRLMKEGRTPRVIVLENVCGALSSHDGKDFATICDGFQQAGYAVGAVVVDAKLFVPQSRPRLFIIAVDRNAQVPEDVTAKGPLPWHPRHLRTAYGHLAPTTKREWIWWNLPLPPKREASFTDLIEDNPESVSWFSAEETRHLLGMMSPINRAKVTEAKRQGRKIVGGVYKRTRLNEKGRKVQRAEVRFDDVSGCLRTPMGGSSRQVIVVVDGRSVKARLISSRETARLMGLPDDYILPENYNEAYHITGDGVVVPVVRHLAEHIFRTRVRRLPAADDGSGMSVIPCQKNSVLEKLIQDYAEALKTEAHKLGTHGLTEEEFYNSGLFRGAIERTRGQFSATMREKREFVRHVLNYMQDRAFIQDWESAGEANRHDYVVQLKTGRVGVIELKGCLDGNNTTIFDRPSHAQEFIIWSVCTNPGADPQKNAWSGIHTRLSADIIERQQRVDGLMIWDMVCGTVGRPCPKLEGAPERATAVAHYMLAPPCIYIFPATIASPRNNPKPVAQSLDDVQLLKAFHECFRGKAEEVNYVDFEIAHRGAETMRKTCIRRTGAVVQESKLTAIQRT